MKFVSRVIQKTIREAAKSFPAIVLTGPRRAGKSTLLRHMFPAARYVLLEDPDIQSRAKSDPRALLDELKPPVLLDEIQNAPELFDYIRTLIDNRPREMGNWLFTGSQEAPLMRGVTESMAGRAAILQLLSFSRSETPRVTVLHGGFPEVLARPNTRDLWFSSYIQTYLERDVRAVTNIRDLATFRRFLSLVASRHGQLVNRTDLAAPLGVSVPTISDWLHILEVTGQIILVPPYFDNFGKRLIKSPKLYIGDSGLACHLLNIRTAADLDRSPFCGSIFEGYVAAEILKSQINRGQRKELYHFRDQQGLEVDFLFPQPTGGGLWMVECKASKTPLPSMARSIESLRRAISGQTRSTLVHRASSNTPETTALAPGVEALDVDTFTAALSGRKTLASRPSNMASSKLDGYPAKSRSRL